MMNPAQMRGMEMARELFRENPQLSVDSAARTIAAQCDFVPHKALLSAMRRQVKETLAQEPRPNPPPPLPPKPEPFNPPRLSIAPTPELVLEKPVDKRIANLDAARASRGGKAVEKLRWLEGWALENPEATLGVAHAAVRNRFGTSMGNPAMMQVLRMTRSAAGLPERLRPGPRRGTSEMAVTVEPARPRSAALETFQRSTPALGAFANIIQQLRGYAVTRVELKPDGSFLIEGKASE